MKLGFNIVLISGVLLFACTVQKPKTEVRNSGNPVLKGWYADPDAAIFKKEGWIVPTSSIDCQKQVYFDAFSSKDLVNWTKHERVVDSNNVKWAKTCFWAPGITTKSKKYYIFFSAKGRNFSHSIGVCVANKPGGPYKDLLGKPLLSIRHNGAQPIDQSIFKDSDGQYYMVYGGEAHCNIVKLKDDFSGFLPFDDGTLFKEITPGKDFVEGSVMFVRNKKYYLMWSEGLWFASNYRVAYGVADSPAGPFKRMDTILQGDDKIASGPGHHSIINIPGTDEWYFIYHRRPLGDNDGNHRVTCIDKMYFNQDGTIKRVQMTNEGIEAVNLLAIK